MQLLLLRHGIAIQSQGTDTDAQRPLTSRGRQRTAAAVKGLARIADRPEAILTSPKRRAHQTAGIAGEAFDLSPEVVGVLSNGPPSAIRRMLARRSETSLMLVGHEPWMSGLIESLCTDTRRRGWLELKKAGCALIDAPLHADDLPGRATLHWLIPPRALRALAE